jgi:toluene monooxygenase system protein A
VLKREEWLHLARKLDWEYWHVTEEEVFPKIISGTPWLPHSEWQDWEEAFKTSYREYVENQHDKDMAVYAVRDAVGRLEDTQKLNTPWINGLKIHAAALPLAEFTGVVGNLRGARFGRDSAWRTMAVFGAGRIPAHPDFSAIASRTGSLGRSIRLDPQVLSHQQLVCDRGPTLLR